LGSPFLTFEAFGMLILVASVYMSRTPRPFGAWTLILVIDLAALAFGLAYKVPTPLMPQWLRAEIETGDTPVARPDQGDWLLFWIVASMVVAANIGAVLLLLVFQ
jgi:hypothetical protein